MTIFTCRIKNSIIIDFEERSDFHPNKYFKTMVDQNNIRNLMVNMHLFILKEYFLYVQLTKSCPNKNVMEHSTLYF